MRSLTVKARDARVRALIEPDVLELLDRLPRDEVVAAAAVDQGRIVSVAAGHHDRSREVIELLSIGTLDDWSGSRAAPMALRQLRTVSAVVFDPTGPPVPERVRVLRSAGLRPDPVGWIWFQGDRAMGEPLRQALRPPSLPPHCSLADLRPEQVAHLRSRGSYSPNPLDLPRCSSVILDDDGTPLAFLLVRGHPAGVMPHWLWVDPKHRRRRLRAMAIHVLLDLFDEYSVHVPIVFRVREDNAIFLATLDKYPKAALTRIGRTTSWRAGVLDEAPPTGA